MNTVKSFLCLLALIAVYGSTFLVVCSLALDVVLRFRILPFDAYPSYTMIAVVVLTIVPLLVSVLAVFFLLRVRTLRDHLIPLTRSRAWLVGTVAVSFAITLFFGVPAVDTNQHQVVVSEYKRVLENNPEEVGKGHPVFRSYVTIPIAPCVLFSYHEGAWAGRGAYGEFMVHVWYGPGVKKVWSNAVWG